MLSTRKRRLGVKKILKNSEEKRKALVHNNKVTDLRYVNENSFGDEDEKSTTLYSHPPQSTFLRDYRNKKKIYIYWAFWSGGRWQERFNVFFSLLFSRFFFSCSHDTVLISWITLLKAIFLILSSAVSTLHCSMPTAFFKPARFVFIYISSHDADDQEKEGEKKRRKECASCNASHNEPRPFSFN